MAALCVFGIFLSVAHSEANKLGASRRSILSFVSCLSVAVRLSWPSLELGSSKKTEAIVLAVGADQQRRWA